MRAMRGHGFEVIRQADPARLALWIREQAAAELPQLARIDLQQTPGCGAVLCRGMRYRLARC